MNIPADLAPVPGSCLSLGGRPSFVGRRPSLVVALLLAGFTLWGGSGCGAVAVIHDHLLGPFSPAGRLEPGVRGHRLVLGRRGLRTGATDEPRLRAYPPSFISQRLTRFDLAANGLMLSIANRSILTHQVGTEGHQLPRQAASELVVGECKPADAVAAMGPPALWLRRAAGDVLIWRQEKVRHLELRVGLGPASRFIPIPLVGNIELDLRFGNQTEERLALLFSPEGRLDVVVDSEDRVGSGAASVVEEAGIPTPVGAVLDSEDRVGSGAASVVEEAGPPAPLGAVLDSEHRIGSGAASVVEEAGSPAPLGAVEGGQ